MDLDKIERIPLSKDIYENEKEITAVEIDNYKTRSILFSKRLIATKTKSVKKRSNSIRKSVFRSTRMSIRNTPKNRQKTP